MPPQPIALFPRPTLEQAELFRRRAWLAFQRAALSAREAELAHLRAQLLSFKGRYIRQVGVLYIKLDDWEDRIAQLNGTPLPSIAAPDPEAVTPTTPEPEQSTLSLKSLFREVAKRIHPDFASDHADAQHRHNLMAQANDAYVRNDAAILQRMLNGHEASTEPDTTAADLARTDIQIQQIAADIASIDAEIEALAQSQMAQLRARSILAATKGQDLLADIAARVKGRISLAMRRYEFDAARLKRKQAPFDPTALLSAETNPDPPAQPGTG